MNNFAEKYSRDIMSALTIFSAVLVGEVILASFWSSKGVFDQFNIIFDADAALWLDMFSTGWTPDHLMHPYGNYLVSIPIKILSEIGSLTGLTDDPTSFSRRLALYIAPFFTALKSVCFYILFRMLNFTTLHSTLITIFSVLSFSSVVFGATPSSYPLSGFAFTFTILCSMLVIKYSNKYSNALYYGASLFAVGLTSSNIIFVGWMRWFINLSRGCNPYKSLLNAMLNSAALLLFVIISFYTLNHIVSKVRDVDPTSSQSEYLAQFLDKYVPPISVQAEKAVRFPEMMGRSIVATMPVQNPDTNLFEYNDPIKVELSYVKKDFDYVSLICTLVALILIGGGGIINYHKGGILKFLTISSAAAIISYWGFYSWLGMSIFIYSQIWHIPVVFLASGWLHKPLFSNRLGMGLIVTILFLMLISNIYVISTFSEWFVPFNPSPA